MDGTDPNQRGNPRNWAVLSPARSRVAMIPVGAGSPHLEYLPTGGGMAIRSHCIYCIRSEGRQIGVSICSASY